MALSEDERQVLVFNLGVEMVPAEATPMSVDAVFQMIVEAYNSGLTSGHLQAAEDEPEETAQDQDATLMFVKDMELSADGVLTTLLWHADGAAPDPALMHFPTRKVRTAGKTRDDGLAHAAHLVISTTKHLSKTKQARSLLERVPGLGRGSVVTYLNRVLRHKAAADKMTFADASDGRIKRCHPKLTSASQLSHHLKRDLEDGKLSRIEFIKNRVVPGFEEADVVEPIRQSIACRVVKSPSGSNLKDLIERAKAWGKTHHYDEMQIKFRQTKTSRTSSARFATELQDAEDAVYSRLEEIRNFKQKLSQCPELISAEIGGKMTALFGMERVWE